MSVKRRDNKNRILHNRESQLKDGRYMYKYVDNVGKSRYVYSWRLVVTDTIYILLYTGLRISEFVGLTISDIDLENKCRPSASA